LLLNVLYIRESFECFKQYIPDAPEYPRTSFKVVPDAPEYPRTSFKVVPDVHALY